MFFSHNGVQIRNISPCLFVRLYIFIICVIILSCKTVPQAPSSAIMGKGSMSERRMRIFFLSQNAAVDQQKLDRIIRLYRKEAAIEGVSADIAFAQMCLETGFLQFNGVVTDTMNNFCGLGAISKEQRGIIFETEQIGVRAHIQHLKAYASPDPLNRPCVDPRYRYVNPKGKAPDIRLLTGSWAVDPEYGNKLQDILNRMYRTP